ncbi:hypothetical protein Tco_0189694 [Tanacetum coccineum]
MADNRTMTQLLQAPTEGYEDAIVIPEINANFELKHGLINLVQNKQFFGHDKEDPHAHIPPQLQGVSKTDFENLCQAMMHYENMQNQGQGSLPINTVTNPKEDLKGITTRSGVVYQGPTIPITSSPRVVERRTEVTKDTIFPNNNGITEDVQPLVVLVENQNPVSELVNAPVSAPMPNPKPSIPYLSRRNDEKHRENA